MRSEAFAFLDAGCRISLKPHSIDAVALAVDAGHWMLKGPRPGLADGRRSKPESAAPGPEETEHSAQYDAAPVLSSNEVGSTCSAAAISSRSADLGRSQDGIRATFSDTAGA
jgi:hypothetical protein